MKDFCSLVVLLFFPSILSVLTRCPVSADIKTPHSMTLPSTYVTVYEWSFLRCEPHISLLNFSCLQKNGVEKVAASKELQEEIPLK